MKICFFSGDISRTGGTERVCLLIANELSKKYDVSILSFYNGLETTFKCDKKLKLYSLHLENSKNFFSRKINPFMRLKKFLKENPQDVLINVDIILSLYSIPMKFFSNIKVISWEHFNFRENNGVKNRDKARKLSAKYADYIIVLTNTDLKEYRTKLKLKSRIKRIYNPIVGKVKNNYSVNKIVLSSGRFAYPKNFQELIKIWEKVVEKNPDWRLIICGDGKDKEEIEKMIADKHIKNIILPGFCKDMEKYYQDASIFAMTSRNEGFPMVLLEAQQYSIPLIAYDCFTGPSEIIEDGKNGYLIEYGNFDDYVKKLDSMIKDNNKLEEFSINSSTMVKRFDIDKIITDWEDVLNNL